MNLYQLYYFRTLAKLEHYTKAAAALSMTQPSLSHAISALENELGVALFEKKGRNVKLSKYGKAFLPFVERSLENLEAGTKKIKELASNTRNIISIGFIYTLSSNFIPDLIAGFLNDEQHKSEQHREIEFSLHEGGITSEECTAGLIRGLKNETLDLIFISLIPKNDPDIVFIPIGEQNLIVIMPNDCPLACHKTIDLRDTKPYPLIYYKSKNGLKNEINHLFALVNMVPKVYCEVEDEISMAGLVAAKIGIAIVPYSPTFRNFNIKILPIDNPKYKRVIYLGYMKNRHLTEHVQRFINYTIKEGKNLLENVMK